RAPNIVFTVLHLVVHELITKSRRRRDLPRGLPLRLERGGGGVGHARQGQRVIARRRYAESLVEGGRERQVACREPADAAAVDAAVDNTNTVRVEVLPLI